MKQKHSSDGLIWIGCLLIILAVASRLIPHPMNFAPIGAIGLFSGAYLTSRYLWLVPIAALLLGDFIIGFYDPTVMIFVYIAFALTALIGKLFLSQNKKPIQILGAAVSSATVFFIMSNFGLWLSGQYYPMTPAGLIECYIMAIPFYGNTLVGDLFYTFILFGVFEATRELFNRYNDTSFDIQ